jgi:hypothetical protein
MTPLFPAWIVERVRYVAHAFYILPHISPQGNQLHIKGDSISPFLRKATRFEVILQVRGDDCDEKSLE